MQRAHDTHCRTAERLAKGTIATVVLPSGRALNVVRQKHGISERALAEKLGYGGGSEVHRQLTGEHRVDLDRLTEADPRLALAFHEFQAAALSVFLDETQRRASLSTRILSSTAFVGDAARETRDALADGRIDAAEAQRISVACLRAADELRATAAQVAQIAAEGREGER